MVKSILTGLDGSPYSQSALDLGIAWSKRFGSTLVGLGIVDKPHIYQPEMVPIGAGYYKDHSDETVFAQAKAKVEALLKEFHERCGKAGITCKELAEIGDPYEQIQEEAQCYDLVMLGKQTHFEFMTRKGPDETLSRVLRNTPRPVIAAPLNYTEGKSVIIGYDGSLQAARALQAFAALGLGSVWPVHVVGVGADKAAASAPVARAIEFLSYHGVAATPRIIVSHESPGAAILGAVSSLDAGLVVTGAYGQPSIKEFFLGSVTKTLLKDCPVPLFLYH